MSDFKKVIAMALVTIVVAAGMFGIVIIGVQDMRDQAIQMTRQRVDITRTNTAATTKVHIGTVDKDNRSYDVWQDKTGKLYYVEKSIK